MIGLVTRGGRAQRYEDKLKLATRREDLEEIAVEYEKAVMLRLLGPHQALRLERLRTELDDVLENQLSQDLYELPSERHPDEAHMYQQEGHDHKKIPKI